MAASQTEHRDEDARPKFGKERAIPLRGLKEDARVQLVEDEEVVGRLEVTHRGTTWRYGVDSDQRVSFLDVRDQDRQRVDIGEPDWMYSVFVQVGVEDR